MLERLEYCGNSSGRAGPAMKLIHEYLEQSVQFERMAEEADNPTLREQLLKQAAAYRKLAEKRAAQLAKETGGASASEAHPAPSASPNS
jgi:hypothetical protein